MIKRTTEHLQDQIERLVREHLAAQRSAVTAAVDRAFSTVSASPARRSAVRAVASQRRNATEMAELSERIYEAVRTHPGETILAIAAELSETPRALSRPMAALKRSGRVRSAGQRNMMRYFPMSAAKAS